MSNVIYCSGCQANSEYIEYDDYWQCPKCSRLLKKKDWDETMRELEELAVRAKKILEADHSPLANAIAKSTLKFAFETKWQSKN